MAWVNGKNGTFNISTGNSSISGYVKWQEVYDIAANKSKVTLTAYLHRTNIYDGPTWFDSGTVTRTAYFGSETVSTTVITGMRVEGNTSANGGAYTQVYSAEKEIAHDADGNKSIVLGFAMSNNVSGVAGQSFTVPKTTATVSLTTIPRATIPNLSALTVTMGNTINITLSPAVSTFKHKIRYEFGSLVSQINGVKFGGEQVKAETYIPSGTVSFTPPGALGSQIPSAKSGKGKLIVYTYREDGTHIGTHTAEIIINVPSYSISVNVDITGKNMLNNHYVSGKSSMGITITADTSYGASIESYSTVVDGKTYTGDIFTTSVLSSGSKSAVVTVTDSRGIKTEYTSESKTVYAYSIPVITDFTLERQPDGTTVVATVKGSVASVNNQNAKTITVTLNKKTQNIVSNSYTINGTTTFTDISTDNTFTGTVTITDSYTSVKKDAVLPTVAVTMDFLYTGNGVAFGKVAETEKLLDVAWDTKIDGEMNVTKEIKTGSPEKTLASFSFRGTNPITKASQDTLDFWAAQGNLATAFFTSGTEDMAKPSTWGYVLHIASNPGTKEFHQLWLEQSNGSIHHRGANASALNPWKMMLDNSNCPDFVVEQGTVDGWEYTKWKNGKMELFSAKSLSFPEGTKQTDYLYRSIVSLDLSKYFTKIMSGTCCVQTNGMVPQVCRHSTNLATAEIVIVTSRTIPAFTITAPLYIIGKWK